jgi:hypothetical protein
MSEPRKQTPASPAARYRHLPERIPPEELIAQQPASDAPDPEMGRDPDRDWLLRGG